MANTLKSYAFESADEGIAEIGSAKDKAGFELLFDGWVDEGRMRVLGVGSTQKWNGETGRRYVVVYTHD